MWPTTVAAASQTRSRSSRWRSGSPTRRSCSRTSGDGWRSRSRNGSCGATAGNWRVEVAVRYPAVVLRFADAELLSFDIDGTLTDATTWWAGPESGWVQRYSVRDGEALLRIRQRRIVVPLSRNRTK